MHLLNSEISEKNHFLSKKADGTIKAMNKFYSRYIGAPDNYFSTIIDKSHFSVFAFESDHYFWIKNPEIIEKVISHIQKNKFLTIQYLFFMACHINTWHNIENNRG